MHPLWKTWKPYAFLAVGAIVGTWWWTTLSPIAGLKAGTYDCVAVYVNSQGKFELLVADGRSFAGHARVESGAVTSYSVPDVLGWKSGADDIIRSKGTKKFHATQEQAVHSYNALACEWSGA